MAKAKKRIGRPKSYAMVIRVRVPAKYVPYMKVDSVFARTEDGDLHELEILNAYYDKVGQPNAMPGC